MSYGQSYPQGQKQGPPQGNPGQVLGIVSIVLGLTCGLSLFGLVAGFVSRSRSKRAGAPATLGTIGLVVSAVALLVLIGGAVALGLGINEVSERCEGIGSGNTYEQDGVTITCP